jgi:hypothetical protein
MKKISIWLLAGMLFCMAGYSQEKPVPLGNASDLLTTFHKQISASPSQRITGRLALRISAVDTHTQSVVYRF